MNRVFGSPRRRACMLAALAFLWILVAGADRGESRIPQPAPTSDLGRAPVADRVRALDVLVVLYPRSFSHALSRSQLERLHEEVLEFVEFYRGSVGDAVEFHVSLLQIDRELALAEVSEVAPGRYYLAREDIEEELVALGMDEPGFDEVVVLYAWNNANPAGAKLAYGGGAVGPDGGFLGDAGYNSIGVFAWDPGRISQIMIHEVLHNIDDMFSMSGMPDEFLNSDEMSRNMSALLRKRPGAFLPQYDDDEMLSYAERELANRATYPWSMQLIYYRWMLERIPSTAWRALDYGRTVERATDASRATRPLYERIFMSRTNEVLYLVVSTGAGEGSVRLGGEPVRLKRRTYRHTDFDGRVLYEGEYAGGWIDLPDEGEGLTLRVGEGTTEVVRLAMGEIVAPPRTVIRTESAVRGARSADSAVLSVMVEETAFAGGGAPISAELSAIVEGQELPVRSEEAGRFAVDVSSLPRGRHEVRLRARASNRIIRDRTVIVERRSFWRLETEDRMVAGIGEPLDITLRIGRADGARGAEVSARVGGRTSKLEELEDGRYSTAIAAGLPSGLDTIRIRADLPDGETLEKSIPIYVEPRGWIEAPRKLTAGPDGSVQLEARVRDRMGEVVRGAGLPIALVVGSGLVPMREVDGSGLYRAWVNLPTGVDRLYLIGLEGSFERRVVVVEREDRQGAPSPYVREAGGERPARVGGAVSPAVAPRLDFDLRLDGDLEEWDGLPAISLGPNAHVLGDPAEYRGAADLSGSFHLAWDSVYLYVGGAVEDDSLTTGAAWSSDRINLFLDLRNDNHPLRYGGEVPDASRWDEDDGWIYAHIVGDGDPPYPAMRMASGYHGPVPGGELVSRKGTAGWTFEMRVPWAALPEGRPFIGAVLGLQLFVSDGDGSGRLTELLWNDGWGWSPDAGLRWEIWRLGRLVLAGERFGATGPEER